MQPDRIIIGEVRGAEALDMLQTMNTGRDGSLTTIHANSQRRAPRLGTMVAMASLGSSRRGRASAGGLDDQHRRGSPRLADGQRRVINISGGWGWR